MITDTDTDTNALEEYYTNLTDNLTIENYACTILNSRQLHALQTNVSVIYKLEILFTVDQIQDNDISILIDYLKSEIGKNIKILYLMSSRLNNEQAKRLTENLVKTSCHLKELSLWENDLHGNLSFLRNIKHFNDSLKLLNLSDNNLSNSCEYIIEILDSCLLIEKLDLSNCDLNDTDLEKLCLAVKKHPNITTLSLGYNKKITDPSAKFIKDLIQHHDKLNWVNLLGTKISNKNIEELTKIAATRKIEIKLPKPYYNNYHRCIIC